MVLANIWCAVDFTLLQMSGNRKHKHEASTLSMQVLVSVRLYLYKHMHAGTLMPHYLNQGKINAVSMEINYISLSELG